MTSPAGLETSEQYMAIARRWFTEGWTGNLAMVDDIFSEDRQAGITSGRRGSMDLRLDGQNAVVTGASRGIGLAVTRGLAAEGVRVTAGALKSSAELDELAGSGLVRVVEVDLADPGGPARLVAAAGDRIDILVNNVGAAPARPGGFGDITDEDWQASLTLNLMAAVRTTRAALPVMLAAGKGAIVTVSSVNAFLPDPGVMDYGAAKAALANFSKALSKQAGPHGIRVNTISPAARLGDPPVPP